IASLTKLMSYLLIQEALEAGSIHADDLVPISPAAAELARSADGVLPLTAGTTLPFQELLDAMLLASSNEAALALAEHVSGSEAAFVEAMNQRAQALHLNSARFYSAHGLPVYTHSATPVKQQNRMSASDMFRLIRYLLDQQPQLTAITSRQFGQMPSVPYTTANSNPLVFNMPGVSGLKTGSTNKAGYCLAATLPMTVDGETHTVVLVLLGAETADVRGQAAQILLEYAVRTLGEDHANRAA
ncbi:MAG: D-alanyl-D-alanine carboxypeptidase, partial [Oscillospiraceae bacterium]|nr:D-alanyl-D-alanine carboxypeptidase [Oscillospiraceae bacterium]